MSLNNYYGSFRCVLIQMNMTEFISNRATKGGGVSLTSSNQEYDINLSWLLISENHAEEGGGVFLEKNDWRQYIHIENSRIMSNCAKKGGGVFVLI